MTSNLSIENVKSVVSLLLDPSIALPKRVHQFAMGAAFVGLLFTLKSVHKIYSWHTRSIIPDEMKLVKIEMLLGEAEKTSDENTIRSHLLTSETLAVSIGEEDLDDQEAAWMRLTTFYAAKKETESALRCALNLSSSSNLIQAAELISAQSPVNEKSLDLLLTKAFNSFRNIIEFEDRFNKILQLARLLHKFQQGDLMIGFVNSAIELAQKNLYLENQVLLYCKIAACQHDCNLDSAAMLDKAEEILNKAQTHSSAEKLLPLRLALINTYLSCTKDKENIPHQINQKIDDHLKKADEVFLDKDKTRLVLKHLPERIQIAKQQKGQHNKTASEKLLSDVRTNINDYAFSNERNLDPSSFTALIDNRLTLAKAFKSADLLDDASVQLEVAAQAISARLKTFDPKAPTSDASTELLDGVVQCWVDVVQAHWQANAGEKPKKPLQEISVKITELYTKGNLPIKPATNIRFFINSVYLSGEGKGKTVSTKGLPSCSHYLLITERTPNEIKKTLPNLLSFYADIGDMETPRTLFPNIPWKASILDLAIRNACSLSEEKPNYAPLLLPFAETLLEELAQDSPSHYAQSLPILALAHAKAGNQDACHELIGKKAQPQTEKHYAISVLFAALSALTYVEPRIGLPLLTTTIWLQGF